MFLKVRKTSSLYLAFFTTRVGDASRSQNDTRLSEVTLRVTAVPCGVFVSVLPLPLSSVRDSVVPELAEPL